MHDTQVFHHGLQKVIEHLPVVVFEYTFYPDGNRGFTYISPRSSELLGMDPDLILEGNMDMTRYVHPDDVRGFHQSVEHSVRTLSEWRWKGRCTGRDGFLWVETRSNPVQMDDGRVIFHGIISDISETRRLEDRNIMTESRYRNLVEQLPLGIVVHSGGVIRFANAYAGKVMGAAEPSQLVGKDALMFVHPEMRQKAAERVEAVLNGHVVPSTELKFIRFDGKEIIVESTGYPTLYEGSPAVQVIFADITDRKLTEAGFRKSETLFVELFQNTPLAIVLLNERSEVVQVNKGFEELFGYSYSELVGKTLTDAIVPAELEKEGNEINNLITENKVIRVETVRRCKNGNQVSVIIYGVPVVMKDEKIGIFGMYVDITDRKKMEEELRIRNTELDNFVYKVSHDLRAPLSSVLGLAHLAAMPGNRDDLSNYVKLMGEKAMQLDHFISDVLSHSKNLKMDISVDRVEIREIIDKTFNDLNYLTGANDVRKEVFVSGSELYSDQWRIGEIFRNLISNAIKYRRLHVSNALVRVDVRVTPEHCEIMVEDNGIGVEESLAPRIFEMFFRASDRSDGSGLGLYIVKNAVDRLGGTVEVKSKAMEGTRFRILVPNLIPK